MTASENQIDQAIAAIDYARSLLNKSMDELQKGLRENDAVSNELYYSLEDRARVAHNAMCDLAASLRLTAVTSR